MQQGVAMGACFRASKNYETRVSEEKGQPESPLRREGVKRIENNKEDILYTVSIQPHHRKERYSFGHITGTMRNHEKNRRLKTFVQTCVGE